MADSKTRRLRMALAQTKNPTRIALRLVRRLRAAPMTGALVVVLLGFVAGCGSQVEVSSRDEAPVVQQVRGCGAPAPTPKPRPVVEMCR